MVLYLETVRRFTWHPLVFVTQWHTCIWLSAEIDSNWKWYTFNMLQYVDAKSYELQIRYLLPGYYIRTIVEIMSIWLNIGISGNIDVYMIIRWNWFKLKVLHKTYCNMIVYAKSYERQIRYLLPGYCRNYSWNNVNLAKCRNIWKYWQYICRCRLDIQLIPYLT